MPREATRDDIVRAGLAGVKMHLRRGEKARALFYLGMTWSHITPQTETKLQAEADDIRVKLFSEGRSGGRSLRDFMNEKPVDPHYFVVNAKGYILCVDDRFHMPGLVGSDGGGVMPRTWKTERGALAHARMHEGAEVRFSKHAP